jgi:branched-chain amino acid transport system ATP-binding protein
MSAAEPPQDANSAPSGGSAAARDHTSDPILRTEHLMKRFGGLTAVDDLSLSLSRGQLHAIIGPNGAGKTTFFNLVSGLLPVTSGRVFFDGHDITGLKPHQISRLGIKRTLQIKSVFNQLTVADNLWVTRQAGKRFLHPFRAASRDVDTRERVDRTLEEIGMTALAGRLAGTLSYGDVALLEIGMALISEPRLLLLDEPT